MNTFQPLIPRRVACFVRLFSLTVGCGLICANATTINFSSLSQAGTASTNEGISYSQQGFTFADQGNAGGSQLAVWQASSPNLPGLAAANTSLFEYNLGSTTLLTQIGNGAFILNSIDLAQINGQQSVGSFSVSFTGTHPDLSTVTQTFTVNRSTGTPALQTFTFAGFTNLSSVSFTQGTSSEGTGYQFDNLVIGASAVPEPGTFLLGAFSFFGLGVGRRILRRL